jgi:membrane associated rhomboid family serine protease
LDNDWGKMLIIPHTGKMRWTNPPLITLLLILTNCFVFFAWQGNEAQFYQEAQEHYYESGLAEIEQEAYFTYLKTTGRQEQLSYLEKLDHDAPESRFIILQAIESDDTFYRKLTNDEIITPQIKVYGQWKPLRQEFDRILGQSPTYTYGYKSAESRFLTTLTYMFLHGGLMHLVGNMVFLWLVGCMIEMGCHRIIYLSTYLLTGIIACLFFGLIYPDSSIPLVGASGAIAGLMGFYTVMFGRKKVGVFLSLGFYFINTRLPAVVLLPFWIGNELYQLYLGGPSNVAYIAHLGGLFSGAMAGMAQKNFLGGVREVVTEEEKEDKIASLMESGLQKLSNLQFSEARVWFEKVLQLDQNHCRALLHLFQIDKRAPGHENFHNTANKLLANLCRTPNEAAECLERYKEYMSATDAPQLSVEIYVSVTGHYVKKGELDEAAAILVFLLKNHAALPQLPGGLLNLARAYLQQGITGKADKCLNILCKKYPDTPEHRIALSMLKSR